VASIFYKFVDGGWKGSWILGQKDGATRVAYISGVSAPFGFPLDADGDGATGKSLADLQMTVVMRSVAANQKLSVFANEKPVTTLDVGKDRAAYDFTLPAAALTLGENRVRLTFRNAAAIAGGKRAAAAIESIEIGPAPRPAAAGIPASPTRGLANPTEIDLGGVKKSALSIPEASRLSYYLQVPAKAKLALAYGSAQPGVTAQIRVARDGAAPTVLFEGRRCAVHRRCLGSVRLCRPGRAHRSDFARRRDRLGEPRLLVPGSVPAPTAKHTFEHVYVWMCDTLRADKVHVYNPKTNVLTPNYDAFAADATRFAWAQVPGTWSLPSQASMLTGVYPNVHKATEHESKINAQLPIAAEIFKKAGFRTPGFSRRTATFRPSGALAAASTRTATSCARICPTGRTTCGPRPRNGSCPARRKPQFVYLAVIEPHVIYNPKKEFLKKYWDKPYTGPIKPVLTGIQLGKIKQGTLKVNDTDKAYLEALHNAEITQSDTAFGVFLADLKAAGLYDTSAIIVISDHGDEFWDHGDVGHAQGPHQELVHVPS
jgi:hypothetical protein